MKTDRPGWGLWSLPHPTCRSFPAPPPASLGFTHAAPHMGPKVGEAPDRAQGRELAGAQSRRVTLASTRAQRAGTSHLSSYSPRSPQLWATLGSVLMLASAARKYGVCVVGG